MKCPTTGKTMYDHKRDAQTCINSRKHAGPLRAYPCPFCGAWHLTSKAINELVPKKFLNQPIIHQNDFRKYIDR